MQIINEAIVDGYHFIVSDTYVTITKDSNELVMLSPSDASEVFSWLVSKVKTSKPANATMIYTDDPRNYKQLVPSESTNEYNPGNRKASTTTSIGSGNPFLAEQAPSASSDGRFQIKGVIDEDLGKAVIESGSPIIHK